MKITNILTEKLIRVKLPGNDKEDIVNGVIDILDGDERIKDLEKVRQAIFDREKIMSTGVGKGFAIPHGKTDAVTDIVAAFAVTEQPVDYQSLDDDPVRLVFLLVGKDNLVGAHIKYLSRISRLMSKDDFREKLLAAGTPAQVLALFQEEEKQYDN